MERSVDVTIIGAGTAGLDAVSEVSKITDNFVLINGGALGTTCARVGCMPSKVLIQVADDFHHRCAFTEEGIGGADGLTADVGGALSYVRSLRDRFVDGVIEELILPLKDRFIEGYAEFIDPTLLKVENMTIRTKKTIIATGSRPVIPDKWKGFKDRILTTDTIFEQTQLPRDMAVVGLGVIGLELGQALSRMGLNVSGFDLLEHIGGLKDPEVNRVAVEIIGKELPMYLGRPVEIKDHEGRLRVISGSQSFVVDKVLLSVGRVPNIERLHLERLGVELGKNGLPQFDPLTMQVGNLPVFMAGDVNHYRPVLHEASHEGLVAGYNAVHTPIIGFQRRTPLMITFSDPNICIAGASWASLEKTNPAVGTARFSGGRVKILHSPGGVVRVYADASGGRILGAEMAAPRGEHLAHLLAWSIQQQLTVFDLLSTPYYHPVLEETLELALSDLADKVKGDSNPLRGLRVVH
ncbi:MAG: dihydrolipoyl dehydrogenase [Deltaproteobacteria bacterium]|nr:dihydrolipoyl dehydrogenase [Deltaproteobacteria bacterium]MBW2151597.1 dihydrolipoyl dehydrogenase [Deltaproteobacteria bacterium]